MEGLHSKQFRIAFYTWEHRGGTRLHPDSKQPKLCR